MSTKTTSELVVDRSPQNELLKITFNMRCENDIGIGCLMCASGAADWWASRIRHSSLGGVAVGDEQDTQQQQR